MDAERRLHPWSWLFVLLVSLREYALPLLALLVFGRRGNEWWESMGAVAALLLALWSVVQYFSYRFRIAADELVIRSGVLHRNVRHIPLARIHNVSLTRNPLHRLFGVAEVRLESAAGGVQAEAQMRVLSLADAAALEALVRQFQGAKVNADREQQVEDGCTPRLGLSTAELVRLGLISNRGLVLLAAGFAAWSQAAPASMNKHIGLFAAELTGGIRDLHWSRLELLLAGALLIVAVIVALRVLSIALAILRFHRFELHDDAARLSVESGLLTRRRSHAALPRVQRWLLEETWLHRRFGRRSLYIETAGAAEPRDGSGIRELLPIAAPEVVESLLQRWVPGLQWAAIDWQPLHPNAWRRLWKLPTLLTVMAVLALTLKAGWPGLLPLVLLPWWQLRARRLAAAAAWAVQGDLLLWRFGWLRRRWSLVAIDRIQVLQLEESPFDRRHGMANLLIDTASARLSELPMRLILLEAAQARALAAQLARRVAAVEPGTTKS